MKIWKLFLFLFLFLALVLQGCGQGGEEAVLAWANGLRETNLSRSPTVSAISTEEKELLGQLDHRYGAFFQTSGKSFRYKSALENLRKRAEIDSEVKIQMIEDFRVTSLPFRGGVTLHNQIFLEAKVLDILSEYANYQALYEKGKTSLLREEALNAIVALHMSEYGKPMAPIFFPSQRLSPEEKKQANQIFRELLGAQFYHEFGHYYLDHSLQKLRANRKKMAGFPMTKGEMLLLNSSHNEDSADEIMGMLSRKAGHHLYLIQEWLDILAFYTEKERQSELTFKKILTPAFQARSHPPYSSLGFRKETMEDGYWLYSGK